MTRELASTISQENLRSIDFGLPQHLRTGMQYQYVVYVHSTAVQYRYQYQLPYSCRVQLYGLQLYCSVLAPVHTYVLVVRYWYCVLVHCGVALYGRTLRVIYVASTISPGTVHAPFLRSIDNAMLHKHQNDGTIERMYQLSCESQLDLY